MRNLKKFIALIITVLSAVALCTFSGCGFISGELWTDVSYDNESAYTVGGGEIAESISEIEIDWTSTEVNVIHYSGSVIKVEETADIEIEESLTLRRLTDSGKLTVQFATNGRHDIKGLNKKLTVFIPNGVTLNKLTIDVVGSNVNTQVAVTELWVNSVTGNVVAENVSGGASVNTGSGNVDLTSSGAIFQAASVSGNIKLALTENLTQANLNTVSGTIELALPETLGFTLTFTKLGGKFNSALDTTQDGNVYTRLDGKAAITVQSVVSNVNIVKNA
ncbi:MAG: DUF4097 family beta strand repeat-containing protein [Candidatus Coproplasma sp.]